MTGLFPDAEVIVPDMADLRSADYERWQELRRQGIGGSDAATIAAVSPYHSLGRTTHGHELTEGERATVLGWLRMVRDGDIKLRFDDDALRCVFTATSEVTEIPWPDTADTAEVA